MLIALITLYQKLLSPDHSWIAGFFPYGFCRFYPTCSEYMKDSVRRRGRVRGTVRGLWRICRCNPWNRGGLDYADT